MPHKKTEGGGKKLPELHFDVCFMGDEGEKGGVVQRSWAVRPGWAMPQVGGPVP